jgi:hypothetical protein
VFCVLNRTRSAATHSKRRRCGASATTFDLHTSITRCESSRLLIGCIRNRGELETKKTLPWTLDSNAQRIRLSGRPSSGGRQTDDGHTSTRGIHTIAGMTAGYGAGLRTAENAVHRWIWTIDEREQIARPCQAQDEAKQKAVFDLH